MRKHPKLRGLLCGVLLGAVILCLFVSTFAALGCLLLALLICPASGIDRFVMRTLPRGGMRFLAGLIAVLLCVLGLALTLTTEPESAAKPEPTEAAESTADPLQTANALDTYLPVYPAEIDPDLAAEAVELTQDIWEGQTIPDPGTVYYIDGTVNFALGGVYDEGFAIDTEIGSIPLVNSRIAFDGQQFVFPTAYALPEMGDVGRFIVTYSIAPTEVGGNPNLLYGADRVTVEIIRLNGETVQLQTSEPSAPTSTPAPTAEPSEAENTGSPAGMNTYVCNVNSKVFHRPSCSSVKNMADYNKQTETCYASTLIAMGYTPCSKCNPN